MHLEQSLEQLEEDITLLIDLLSYAQRVAKDHAPYIELEGSKLMGKLRRHINEIRPNAALPFTVILENVGAVHVWGYGGLARVLKLKPTTIANRLNTNDLKFSRNNPDTGELDLHIEVVRGHVGENSMQAQSILSNTTARAAGRPRKHDVSVPTPRLRVTKEQLKGMSNKLRIFDDPRE